MSWLRLDPEEFWRLDEVQTLDVEAVGLLWWMVGRSWTNGGLIDDPELYRKILRGRCGRFARLWAEVRPKWILQDGELRFPWLEQKRAEAVLLLRSDAERKRLERLGKAERPVDSAGHVRTSGDQAWSPPESTDVRTYERTNGTNETDERTNDFPAHAGPSPAASVPSTNGHVELKVSKPRKEATGDAADARRHWDSEWTRTRPTVWDWSTTADVVAVAGMVKLQGGLDETKLRMTRMLESTDVFAAKHASPKLLKSQWNDWGGQKFMGAGLTGSDAARAYMLRNYGDAT